MLPRKVGMPISLIKEDQNSCEMTPKFDELEKALSSGNHQIRLQINVYRMDSDWVFKKACLNAFY
jgi:hypothetical protein